MREVIILAAGRGTRLGGDRPKPLTAVGVDGETLIARQLRLLAPLRTRGWAFTVVVGHRSDDLRRAVHGVEFVEASRYAQTNTSKSLLEALSRGGGNALWLNADVLFSESFAAQVMTSVEADLDFVGTTRGRVADEEVKFKLNDHGFVTHLSKAVVQGEGEAIGVNHVTARTRASLVEALTRCRDDDYFEAGIEATIADGVRWSSADLTDHFAVEVDFPEDLEAALAYTHHREALEHALH